MDEQNILETQMILGKQVLEIALDLLKNDSKAGAVLPLNIMIMILLSRLKRRSQIETEKHF